MASFKKLTSNNIRAELNQMSKDVAIGSAAAIELLIVLKQIKELVDELETKHQDDFNQAASLYNKQEYDGYMVEIRSGGGRYNYDHIPEIAKLNEQIKELQQKAQTSYRISLTGLNALSNDGELIAAAKFVPSKDSIILKRKKSDN